MLSGHLAAPNVHLTSILKFASITAVAATVRVFLRSTRSTVRSLIFMVCRGVAVNNLDFFAKGVLGLEILLTEQFSFEVEGFVPLDSN